MEVLKKHKQNVQIGTETKITTIWERKYDSQKND